MSKTLLEKENFIIVCDNEKTKLNYLNIASFLFIDLYKADNIYDFVNLFYNGQ
ncbi:MAG: hypothetical protein P1U46_02510 [Patescibacteria group bacterium]|nr:hypothetical protein [Patescibacteria group bacterium]